MSPSPRALWSGASPPQRAAAATTAARLLDRRPPPAGPVLPPGPLRVPPATTGTDDERHGAASGPRRTCCVAAIWRCFSCCSAPSLSRAAYCICCICCRIWWIWCSQLLASSIRVCFSLRPTDARARERAVSSATAAEDERRARGTQSNVPLALFGRLRRPIECRSNQVEIVAKVRLPSRARPRQPWQRCRRPPRRSHQRTRASLRSASVRSFF